MKFGSMYSNLCLYCATLDVSQLSEVEERLTRLESLVGSEDTTVSTVAAGLDAEQKDLSVRKPLQSCGNNLTVT